MSAFLTPLKVELLLDAEGNELRSRDGKQLWRLTAPFIYRSDVAGQDIEAPEGFITDFASIPRIVGWVFGDIGHRPSLPHDFEYSKKGKLPRELADKVLREACILSEIPGWKVALIYAGVRAGGWACFRKD